MAKPRITITYTKGKKGELDEVLFYMNPEGRDLLVKELNHLDERSDHLHMQPEEWGGELPLQMKAYRPGEEELVWSAKMMLRLDEWDREYFPHVIEDGEAGD
jgi:hypothetical protein